MVTDVLLFQLSGDMIVSLALLAEYGHSASTPEKTG
jgi:hypothetical protein